MAALNMLANQDLAGVIVGIVTPLYQEHTAKDPRG